MSLLASGKQSNQSSRSSNRALKLFTKMRKYATVLVNLQNKKPQTDMKTAKHYHRQLHRLRTSTLLAIAMVLVVASSVAHMQVVRADTIQDQIDSLNADNATNQQALTDLTAQATSYQDAIQHLQAQIALVQGQIADNQAKQDVLNQQIHAQQVELDKQRSILAADLKAMYVNGQLSTVEMLATSKSISEYVDSETYRSAVQSKVQSSLSEISRLQNVLEEQKHQIDELLAEQRSQQDTLAAANAEQGRLLALNQAQQNDFNAKTAANQAKIDALVAEQAKLNDPGTPASYYFIRFPGAVKGHNISVDDYPYKTGGFGMSTAPGCVDNDGPDKWFYCTRQCVSYTAWAVERSGRTAPVGYGNAKDWVQAARRNGIPVFTSNPQPGDVAISTAGTWGHAMYVEQVNGNQILVSQYNQQLTGVYSVQWRTYK